MYLFLLTNINKNSLADRIEDKVDGLEEVKQTWEEDPNYHS